MMSPKVEAWTDAVAEQLLQQLTATEPPLRPKQIHIHEVTDTLGEDAWRLVLVLPAPTGQTWDRESVYQTRRMSVELFDELAAAEDHDLPGSTVASVTTDEAPESDIAPEDEPVEGEDPRVR